MSLFSALSPSSLILVSPSPVTLTAALFRLLVSMFTSLSVTSTLPFLPLASMVTVWEEAVLLLLFVMMVLVSTTSLFVPCETLFVPSVSPAFTVMSPSSMRHISAKAGAARVMSIAAVRTNAAAR